MSLPQIQNHAVLHSSHRPVPLLLEVTHQCVHGCILKASWHPATCNGTAHDLAIIRFKLYKLEHSSPPSWRRCRGSCSEPPETAVYLKSSSRRRTNLLYFVCLSLTAEAWHKAGQKASSFIWGRARDRPPVLRKTHADRQLAEQDGNPTSLALLPRVHRRAGREVLSSAHCQQRANLLRLPRGFALNSC